MDVIHVDSLYQRVQVGPDVIVGGWQGAVDFVHHDTDSGRVIIECVSQDEIRRVITDLQGALSLLPDPADLVARQDEPPEGS